MPDAKTKRQMDRYYEEWKRSGCPDGELNKRGSGARERNRGKHNKEKRGYYDDDTPPSSTIYEQEEIVGGHEDDYAQEDAYDWRAVAVGSLVIVAGIAIVVATIAEDVGTGGVGITNDIPSFSAAGSLIARGASIIKSAPRFSPALKPALTY